MSVEDFRCDVRLAWRGLTRAKAFSLATILTLALGIAGTTVMFTLVRGVLLRPLPVRDQERLIVAWKELRSSGFTHHPFGDLEIEAVGRESRLIEAVAGGDANGAGRSVVTENGTSSYVNVAIVTGRFFEVLGVDALLGRPLGPADDDEGAENVVAISHALWTRRYGRARDIIGRRISIDQKRFTIVGVMPSDVDHSGGAEVWRTTRSFGTTGPFGDAARREIDLIARLRPGVTLEQVTSELAALTRRFDERALPGRIRDLVPVVRSYEQAVVGNVRAPLVALLAAVGAGAADRDRERRQSVPDAGGGTPIRAGGSRGGRRRPRPHRAGVAGRESHAVAAGGGGGTDLHLVEPPGAARPGS